MSLGSYNGNNSKDKKEIYSPEVYSGVKFFNSESKIDPSSLTFSYWKGMLKIILTPAKTVEEGSVPEYDKDNSVAIYLTPIRARLFLEYIKNFSDDNDTTNIGIATNLGIVYITNGREEFGLPESGHRFLVVKLVDSEGTITSSIAYQFNQNYYGIQNYTGGTNFIKNYDYSKNLEFNMFIELIEEYVKSSTTAMAASVLDAGKYSHNRLELKLGSIQEKLGVDYKKGNGRGYNNKSFFDQQSGGSSPQKTSSQSAPSVDSYVNYQELIGDLTDIGN